MDNSVQLEQLLASKQNYRYQLSTLLRSIDTSRNKNQILKDIVLFCKTCLTITCKPITKFLALQLIKDIADKQPNQQFMKLIEINLLRKISDICAFDSGNSDDRRGAHIFGQDCNQEDKKIGQDYLRLALESVYVWGKANQNNNYSKFQQALEVLKNKKIKFPLEFKFYDKRTAAKSPMKSPKMQKVQAERSEQSQSVVSSKALSIQNQQSQRILQLMEQFELIKQYIHSEYAKSEKSQTYKIKLRQILTKLSRFKDKYASTIQSLPKQANFYKTLVTYNKLCNQLYDRLKNKKISDQNEVKQIIEEIVINQPDDDQQQDLEDKIYSKYQPKKFDIFSILENIHKRIEIEEKKLGLYGSYELNKNLNLKTEEQSSFLHSQHILSPTLKSRSTKPLPNDESKNTQFIRKQPTK